MQYAPAVARGDASKFVLSWLRANFVSKDGSLLARNEAYELYLAHCQDQLYEPTTSAALGKLIKKVFPDMGTRRLAVNGKKQRFYCGIAYSPAAGHQDTAYCAITWVEETEEAIARDRGGSATARRRKRDRDRDRDDDAGAVVPLRTADAHLELMSVLEYYSRMYKKELWGVNPINPATTDVALLAYGVGSQRSTTLALTSCLLMCSASFLVGHLTIAEDYYHKARVHLGELFDVSDYDIACVLMPFSWWTRLYSGSETEALNKQRYYLMLGKQICERVNALNDQTYFNLTSMSSVIAKQDCSRRLVEVKQQKPFRRSWEPVLGLTHSKTDQHIAGEVQIRIGELYGAMFPICAFYQQNGLDHPERMSHNDLLKHNLGVTNKLDETLAQLIADDQSCTLMYSMMRCQVCAVRTFILWALQSKQRLYAAQNFVQMLLAARTPIRAMTTNELTNNDYLLLRLPVDILVEAGQLQLLRMLLEALQPHTQFYWMRNMCQYIVRRMDEWAPPDVAGGWQDGGEWSSPHPLASQQEESDVEECPLFPTY